MQAAAAIAKSTRREELRDTAKAKASKKKDGQPPADTATAAIASADKPVCRSFAASGKCSYGDRCKFSHGGKRKPAAKAKSKAGEGRGRSQTSPTELKALHTSYVLSQQ